MVRDVCLIGKRVLIGDLQGVLREELGDEVPRDFLAVIKQYFDDIFNVVLALSLISGWRLLRRRYLLPNVWIEFLTVGTCQTARPEVGAAVL